MAENYYVILGLNRGASLNRIRGAYHRKVKQFHPDTSHSDDTTKQFLKVKDAYDTLSDEKKRHAYDEELARQGSSTPVRYPIHDVDETISRRRSYYERFDEFYTETDDFFGGFVTGLFERGLGREKDLCIEIILTPVEAFKGCLVPLTVPVLESCPQCRGTGYWEYFYCPDCSGHGRLACKREFSLAIPPHVPDGTEARVSLEDIGLKNCFLNALIRTPRRSF